MLTEDKSEKAERKPITTLCSLSEATDYFEYLSETHDLKLSSNSTELHSNETRYKMATKNLHAWEMLKLVRACTSKQKETSIKKTSIVS